MRVGHKIIYASKRKRPKMKFDLRVSDKEYQGLVNLNVNREKIKVMMSKIKVRWKIGDKSILLYHRSKAWRLASSLKRELLETDSPILREEKQPSEPKMRIIRR